VTRERLVSTGDLGSEVKEAEERAGRTGCRTQSLLLVTSFCYRSHCDLHSCETVI
jgi:hypothetical protein